MKTKIGFLLSVCVAFFPACRQSTNSGNSNNPANQSANISKPVNSNALEINREDLNREADKVKKDLEESKKNASDPKAESREMHENLQNSQIKNTNQTK